MNAIWIGLLLAAGAAPGAHAEAPVVMPDMPLVAGLVPTYQCLRDFHVDAAAAPGGDGSAAHPWAHPQAANDSGTLRAGDCVDLAPGTYDLTKPLHLAAGGDRNAPDGYVAYRSTVPHEAHLVARRDFYQVIDVQTAYLVIDGLDIDGHHLTTSEAVSASGNPDHHHIVVENSVIRDAGGGGVQMNDSEYFWVVGNLIYGNAATNTYQESGISTYQAQLATHVTPTPADAALPWHIVIAGNISRDNAETYACATPGCHTDGNGIIVDKTKNVDRAGGVPYAGQVLVARNVVARNGGGGVHLFLSDHVTVAGNIAADNHRDPDNNGTWRGELSNVDSDDNRWIGNVGWAMQGAGVLAHNSAVLIAASNGAPAGARVGWDRNLTCGGDTSVYARAPGLDPKRNRLNADPRLCREAMPKDLEE